MSIGETPKAVKFRRARPSGVREKWSARAPEGPPGLTFTSHGPDVQQGPLYQPAKFRRFLCLHDRQKTVNDKKNHKQENSVKSVDISREGSQMGQVAAVRISNIARVLLSIGAL